MLSSRSYAIALAAIGLGITLGLMSFALYLIPLSGTERVMGGNLARMAWLSKNAYGARTPQRLFEPPLFTVGTTLERDHDVVVLGDSFSVDVDKSWPGHLAARGLSVLAINLARNQEAASDAAAIAAQIDGLLESPGFRTHPPRVFVLEMVESTLHRRLVRESVECIEAPGGEPAAVGTANAGDLGRRPPAHQVRDVVAGSRRYDEQQLAYARDFLFRNVQRTLGLWRPEVRFFELRRERFSSRHPRTLLVVSHDLHKASWTDDDIASMRCALLQLQQRVEANGRTTFVAMLVPDKLSAYRPDLVEPALAPVTVIDDRLVAAPLNAPRLDLALRAAIESGTPDVYLPDDTHWGATGHARAADAVLAFLEARGLRWRGEAQRAEGAPVHAAIASGGTAAAK